MKRISFYLYNPGLEGVDCSDILHSNPGIGGTEHEFLLVSMLLSRMKEKYTVKLYLEEPLRGLDIPFEVVDGMKDAIRHAENDNSEVIVFKHMDEYISNDVLQSNSKTLSFFPWVHIFHHRLQLDYYYHNSQVKRVICVGREHRDIFLDHPCINKLCFIYNTLNTDGSYARKVSLNPYGQRSHIVTYVGSLVPEKCFHHLASIWREILNEVPDAELYVIGSGKVYDRTKSLGSFGLAQGDYEHLFMPYLTDSSGAILPSVHFMGNLGIEKENILLKTKVGVPNPWGLSETFCISAVEMQLCGATVVAGECPGYHDTFFNGVIVKDRKKIKDAIVKQLLADSPVMDYDASYEMIKTNFSNEVVAKAWDDMLSNLDSPLTIGDFTNLGYRLKWLKVIMMKLKEFCPLFKSVVPIDNFIQRYESLTKYRAF